MTKKHSDDEQEKGVFSPDYKVHLDNRVKKGKNKNVPVVERIGDWTCQRCFNHNFAFRKECKMCYLSHIESNRMLYG